MQANRRAANRRLATDCLLANKSYAFVSEAAANRRFATARRVCSKSEAFVPNLRFASEAVLTKATLLFAKPEVLQYLRCCLLSFACLQTRRFVSKQHLDLHAYKTVALHSEAVQPLTELRSANKTYRFVTGFVKGMFGVQNLWFCKCKPSTAHKSEAFVRRS